MNTSVLEHNPARVRIHTSTYWYGYGGKGVDSRLDVNHVNTKLITVYSDGRIYVRIQDSLHKGQEVGPTRARSSFIHPMNVKSTTGFTLATNYSMNAASLYRTGGGVAKWLLQCGQDTNPDPVTGVRCTGSCTRMKFLQVPEDLSCAIGEGGRYSETYLQPIAHATGQTIPPCRLPMGPPSTFMQAVPSARIFSTRLAPPGARCCQIW